MSSQFIVKWKRPRKVIPQQELNTYPETPPNTGFFPASKAVEQFRISFDVDLQLLPELNTYPEIPLVELFPAWGVVKTNRFKSRFELQRLLELNFYPVTIGEQYPAFLQPPSFKVSFGRKTLRPEELNNYPETPDPTGFYPGSKRTDGFRVTSKRILQLLPELNTYPLAPTPATLPAFIEQPSFRLLFRRKHLEIIPINPESISVIIPVVPSLLITTDKQQDYTANIDLSVHISDKMISYTTELGG